MATLGWLGEFPADFERAVVINTSASDLSPPWGRMRLRTLPGVTRALTAKDPVAREREILRATTLVFKEHDRLAARWAEYHDEHPMTQRNALRQLLAAMRFRSPARIHVPLLVLAAENDPLARAECGRRIARKYGAPFELHPTAGHDLPLDDARWVTASVTRWIADPPGASSNRAPRAANLD